MDGTDEQQSLPAENAPTLIAGGNDNEVTEEQRKIHSLLQKNSDLQQTLESIIAEREQLKMDLKENIEMVGSSSLQLAVHFYLFTLGFINFIRVESICNTYVMEV